MNQLQRGPSMVDLIEKDYNDKYEGWKRDFYTDNMTDEPPITVGQVVFKASESAESAVIRFLASALIVIIVIFWVIPALYYHGNAAKMDKIGTLYVVEDIMSQRELNGVYVKDGENWREADENEVKYYMETRPDRG